MSSTKPYILAVLLLASYATFQRNRDYSSPVALWESAVRLSPAKSGTHLKLGTAYHQEGRWNEALFSYYRAVHLPEDGAGLKFHFHTAAYTNMAAIYMGAGLLPEAAYVLGQVTEPTEASRMNWDVLVKQLQAQAKFD